MAGESDHSSIDLREILEEGVRIAAILVFWGLFATIGKYGIGNVGYGYPGSLATQLGDAIAVLFVITALASVLIYVIARGLQLSNR